MSCRTALISVGLSWAVGMVLLVLLLEGVGVGVVEAVEAPPFMLRSVGPVERKEGKAASDPRAAPGRAASCELGSKSKDLTCLPGGCALLLGMGLSEQSCKKEALHWGQGGTCQVHGSWH